MKTPEDIHRINRIIELKEEEEEEKEKKIFIKKIDIDLDILELMYDIKIKRKDLGEVLFRSYRIHSFSDTRGYSFIEKEIDKIILLEETEWGLEIYNREIIFSISLFKRSIENYFI